MLVTGVPTMTAMKEQEVVIEGPAGQLELLVGKPHEKPGAWGIVCHPHPLFGGTMHNKIVTTLVKTYQGMGANTVRFNFRGVMRSAGRFDRGEGELADLLAVVDWVREQHPGQTIWLAGFSFGAYIAAKAAMPVGAAKLVTVAPPVQHFSLEGMAPITCRWVLVQGNRDDVVPPEAVLSWAKRCVPPPLIIEFPEAGHYFHGLLGELRAKVEAALLGST